jgi:nucleoside-diphosphate-sugar epimerase
MLRIGGVEPGDALSFAVANLMSDAGWPQAVADCNFVLHVASPFPLKVPKDENELIVPAREGALRVLRAARDAGVCRVVLTSSFAAVGYGTTPGPEPYTEENWTNPDGPGVTPYVKSKTLAERAAWDFMAREGGTLELSVVNPVGVFGPVFSRDFSTSIVIVKRLMDGGVPACPRLKFGAVDVRDVASLHLSAMTHPAATGERFLAVAGSFISILQIAQILRERMGAAASRVPTREMPDWVLRVMGLFDSSIRQIVPELGKYKDATSAKAQRVLGWQPLSAEDSIVATAESLLQLGLVKR